MNDFVKKTAEITGDLVDTFAFMLKKLDAPGRQVVLEDAKGLTGEISVPIKGGKIGEIIVVMQHAYQHYPARAARAQMEFAKGTKVRIADVGSNIMFVEPIDDSYGTTSGELVEM
ncbi:MAG TPA: hypothetical protein V6C81_09915 [Planktothrix sp.]|jgi:hypothetical protein